MDIHTPGTEPVLLAGSTSPGGPAPRDRAVPSRRAAVLIGAAATFLLVAFAVVAVTDPHAGDHAPEGSPALRDEVPMTGHVHAIAAATAVRGERDRVLVGAHYGLFSVQVTGEDAGRVREVGRVQADLMALTEAGVTPRAGAGESDPRGRLLASGHPAVADGSRPANLGLMESRDGGETWTTLSLAGAADFHALDHAAQRLWGIDSVSGALIVSADGRAWDLVHSGPLLDVAADPGDPARAVATTPEGRLIAVAQPDEGRGARLVAGAPRLAFVDRPAGGALVGVGADGTVWRSASGGVDRGGDWTDLARVPGEPTALSVIDGWWYVATDGGLFRGSIERDEAGEAEQVAAFGS